MNCTIVLPGEGKGASYLVFSVYSEEGGAEARDE